MSAKPRIDTSFNYIDGQITSILTLNGQFGQTTQQVTKLNTTKTGLQEKLATIEKEIEKYNKSFQEKIYFKPVPIANNTSTLQDFSLIFFAIGWILLSATVVALGIFQPGGTWKRGLILAALMFIISVVVQGLLSSYA
jgi:hypothetical protein